MKIAFCGNDCDLCPRYLATQSDDKEQLRRVAEMWQRFGWRGATTLPEDMVCDGCIPADSRGCWCRYGIRECALQKNVGTCGECQDYPCEKALRAFQLTEVFANDIKQKCSEQEYEVLQRAFFSKKKNLDKTQEQHSSRMKEKSPNNAFHRTASRRR